VDWKPLAAGIDTLECGYHVTPLAASDRFLGALEALREQARERCKPLPWEDELLPGMLFPGAGAKAGTYRYHLETRIGHVWIRAEAALVGTPNVLVSFSSEALWCQGGPIALIEVVRVWLRQHGLSTDSIQPSRCDLAVDVRVPGGVTREWIEAHLVTRAKSRQVRTDWDTFKGYAIGSRQSPIYARMYDKTLEIAESSHKYWLWDFWGEPLRADVVRIEFQINRSYFRELRPRIDTIDRLFARITDLWRYLTEEWMSLRLPNGQRASRRAMFPGWQSAIDYGLTVFETGCNRLPLVRNHGITGNLEYLRRIGYSWLSSLAANGDTSDPIAAIHHGIGDLLADIDGDEFRERVRLKRIRSGRSLEGLDRIPSGPDLGRLLTIGGQP
jgi:hypothetical protein